MRDSRHVQKQFADAHATVKRIVFHAALRMDDPVAIRPCVFPHERFAVAQDRHAGQAGTPLKGIVADVRHAASDHHAGQPRHSRKRIIVNAGHVVADDQSFHVATVDTVSIPSPLGRNPRHVEVKTADVVTTIERVRCKRVLATPDGHAGQTFAALERPIPDAGHAAPDHEARQPGAVLKRPISDVCHAAADHRVCKGVTIGERTVPDTEHTVRDHHLRQTCTALKRAFANIGHVVTDHDIR